MQHTDKNTDTSIDNDTKKDEQASVVTLIPARPATDEEDCIVLNADVHDEIEVVIEDVVAGQSVIIEATSVVEKSTVQASDIEDAVVVASPTSHVLDVVEVAEAVEIDLDEVDTAVKKMADDVDDVVSTEPFAVVPEVVDVVETEVVSVVEVAEVVDVAWEDATKLDTAQVVEVASTTDVVADVAIEAVPELAPVVMMPNIKELSRTVVNVEVVDTNVIDMTASDVVNEVGDGGVAVDTQPIDIDMSDDVPAEVMAVVDVTVEEANVSDTVNTTNDATNIDIDMGETVKQAQENPSQDDQSHAHVPYLHTHQSEPAVEAVAPVTTYPAETTASTPTLDVSQDSIHKKLTLFPKNFTKPMLFLAGSSVLGIWVMQQSINAYFLQTYHKPSPLANIDNGIWRAGAKIHDGLVGIKNGTEDSPTSASEPTTEPAQDQAEAITLPVEVQAPQQTKEGMIKASLTLNSNQKVFFAGDSLMQGVAPHVQKHLQQFGIKSVNLSKQSTGLAYPKFFDWPNTIKETITKDKDIKVLVVMLGPNDPWDMPVKGSSQYLKFQTPEWDKEYQARMADILNFAKENNVGVIWVTPPNMKKQKLDTQMMYINDVMTAELARHNVQVIDARPVMGSINNQYNDYVEKDGEKIKVRSGDGIHFTPNGQRVLAQHIQSYLTIEP